MRIFISWSGDRSQVVASALADWIPKILQGVKPWLSNRDIGSGAIWSQELFNALKEEHFGILCLTPENLSEPWIHFEAGALAKSIDKSRVVPYLWGGLTPAELVPPLGTFQARICNREDTRKLLSDINKARGSSGVAEEHWSAAFDALFPKLQRQLDLIQEVTDPPASKRSPLEIAEESLGILRTLARQMSTLIDHPTEPVYEPSMATSDRISYTSDDIILKTAIFVANEVAQEIKGVPTSVSRNSLHAAAMRSLRTMGIRSPERHKIAAEAAQLAYEELRARMNEDAARAMRGEEARPPADGFPPVD